MDVPAREARARFAALVELAARGECVTITRYGKTHSGIAVVACCHLLAIGG